MQTIHWDRSPTLCAIVCDLNVPEFVYKSLQFPCLTHDDRYFRYYCASFFQKSISSLCFCYDEEFIVKVPISLATAAPSKATSYDTRFPETFQKHAADAWLLQQQPPPSNAILFTSFMWRLVVGQPAPQRHTGCKRPRRARETDARFPPVTGILLHCAGGVPAASGTRDWTPRKPPSRRIRGFFSPLLIGQVLPPSHWCKWYPFSIFLMPRIQRENRDFKNSNA